MVAVAAAVEAAAVAGYASTTSSISFKEAAAVAEFLLS